MEYLHNTVKLKSLTFLDWRRQCGHQYSTAGQIATGIGGSADSLYVLLARWDAWRLVKRYLDVDGQIGGRPGFVYSTTRTGQSYLRNAGKWWRGDWPELRLQVATSAHLWITWKQYDSLYCAITAPFDSGDCFHSFRTPPGAPPQWDDDLLLLRRNCHDAMTALKTVEDWGLVATDKLLTALLDAGIVRRKQPATGVISFGGRKL